MTEQELKFIREKVGTREKVIPIEVHAINLSILQGWCIGLLDHIEIKNEIFGKFEDRQSFHRAFQWFTKDRHSRTIPCNEIQFGAYSDDGGTTGEMAMRWHNLDGKMIPRLEAFDDSWYLLFQFHDVFKRLSEVGGKAISEQQFVDILLSCGFKDITSY